MLTIRFPWIPLVLSALLWAATSAFAVEGLYFREDTRATPPELPITQAHVSNSALTLHLYGPGGGDVKKSYHENVRNDPHYIYSGTARDGLWALALEKKGSPADLSGSDARFRLRTRNQQRTLHIILRTSDGWIASRQGIGPTPREWTITTLKVADLEWDRFEPGAVRRGSHVRRPDLRRVAQVGFTDFQPGEGSAACSRIDWIEVWERLPSTTLYVVPNVDGYDVYEGDDFLLRYQTRAKTLDGGHARANYVHPLIGLNGETITEDFPVESHNHHRGVFWAWHQTIINGKRIGNSWTCTDFEWDVHAVRILHDDPDSVGIHAIVGWRSPSWHNGEWPFAREYVLIRPHRETAEGRKVDFTISLLALEPDVRLGGAPNDRGYGGFTARLLSPPGMNFQGEVGPLVPQTLSVEGGSWLNLSGELNGNPYAIAILQHPGNPGFPRPWILRYADRPSNHQNPMWPGRNPVLLPTGEPLTLRYRLIVHRGNLDSARAAAEYGRSSPR